LEAIVDQRERLLEALLGSLVDAPDRRAQLGDALLEIRLLRSEEGMPIADLARLVDGGERYLAERIDLLAQRAHLLLGGGNVQLQRRLAPRRRHVGELHQIPLAHRLLEVGDLQPRPLDGQLGPIAALAARPPRRHSLSRASPPPARFRTARELSKARPAARAAALPARFARLRRRSPHRATPAPRA